MNTIIKDFSSLLRLRHWVKNIIIFAPLLFSWEVINQSTIVSAILAFIAFSLISSSIYIINDIHDLEADKQHPKKCNRPLPAGRIKPGFAKILSLFLMGGSLALGWQLRLPFFICIIGYLALNFFYTYKGKKLVIIDAFCIALGFVIRVTSGAFAIDVIPTGWILMTTFFLCLFMGFGKRRNELLALKARSGSHREVLNFYTDSLLNNFILSSGTITIISYTMYTLSPEVNTRYNTEDKLVWTIPFITFAIFRYMYLIWTREEGDPTDVILKDPGLLAAAILWLIATILIIAVSRGIPVF